MVETVMFMFSFWVCYSFHTVFHYYVYSTNTDYFMIKLHSFPTRIVTFAKGVSIVQPLLSSFCSFEVSDAWKLYIFLDICHIGSSEPHWYMINGKENKCFHFLTYILIKYPRPDGIYPKLRGRQERRLRGSLPRISSQVTGDVSEDHGVANGVAKGSRENLQKSTNFGDICWWTSRQW